MAQHSGQNLLPRPHTSISSAPSTSSSDNNSLFSANFSAFDSDSTTPRLTPDHDCDVTTRGKQQPPAGQWVQQEVAQYPHQSQPQEIAYQPQPLRQRPYPDVIYAPQPAYAIPQYAPRPADTPNYAFPVGVATGMMYPGMEMRMAPAGGVIPPLAPGTYLPQQYMGPCSQYPYAYPQYAYPPPPPAPQTTNYAVPSILPSYNPPAPDDAQRAEEAVVPSQVPAQMQESISPVHYADLGRQMAYSNAGFMQQLASAGSSSVPSSSQKGKRKHWASDDDATEPQPKRPKQKRLHPSQDPTLKRDGFDKKGYQLWKCQLPQCIHWPPLRTNSVHNHRQSNCHLQRRDNFMCQYCGQYSSRKDSLKRHLKTCKRKKEREQNAEMGFATHDAAEPGPRSMQHVLVLPLSAGNFSSIVASQPNAQAQASRAELSSVPQQASGIPPLQVFAEEVAMPHVQVSVQAPRHEPRLVSPLPVFAQELFMLPRPVEEDDDTYLFDSPEMSTSLAFPPVPAVQEGTITADVRVDGSALGFDTAALDMSYDDWMNPAV